MQVRILLGALRWVLLVVQHGVVAQRLAHYPNIHADYHYVKRYSDDEVMLAVAEGANVADVLRRLGVTRSSSSHTHMSKRIAKMGLDTSHFDSHAHSRGNPSRHRKSADEILVVSKTRRTGMMLTRSLLEIGREYSCEKCGVGADWQGERLVLEVDHIDGNPLDHRRENLRFLCPNCHSQCWETNRPNRTVDPLNRRSNQCLDCGAPIQLRSLRCRDCSATFNRRPEVIDWPSVEELKARLELLSLSALARELGVSGNAIKKRIKKYE